MKKDMKRQMLLVILVPILLICIITTTYSTFKFSSLVSAQVNQQLKTSAYTLLETLEDTESASMTYSGTSLRIGDLTQDKLTALVQKINQSAKVQISIFAQDKRVVSTLIDEKEDTATGTAADEVVKCVLKEGKDFYSDKMMILGEPYAAFYCPYKDQQGNISGMIFAGKPYTEVHKMIQATILGMYALIGIGVVITILLAMLVLRSIYRVMNEANANLNALADGNLDLEFSESILKRTDVIGQMVESIQTLQQSLKKIAEQLQKSVVVLGGSSDTLVETAKQTNQTTDEVERAIEDISSAAQAQAEDTQSATEQIITMGDQIQHSVEAVELLSSSTKQMSDAAVKAQGILAQLDTSNGKTQDAMESISSQTDRTYESTQKISEATKIITSIASETNLLALNASIEAARAGEQGRGFAVVAAQIKNLAEQSDRSAKEIDKVIADLLNEVQLEVNTMEQVKKIIEEQNVNVTQTQNHFDEVNRGIKDTVSASQSISEATTHLDESRKKVTDVVSGLTAIAEENAASTEQTSAATAELNAAMDEVEQNAGKLKEVAKELETSVNYFKF